MVKIGVVKSTKSRFDTYLDLLDQTVQAHVEEHVPILFLDFERLAYFHDSFVQVGSDTNENFGAKQRVDR